MYNPGISDEDARELFDDPKGDPTSECLTCTFDELDQLERRQRGAEACVIFLAILIVFEWIWRIKNDPAK